MKLSTVFLGIFLISLPYFVSCQEDTQFFDPYKGFYPDGVPSAPQSVELISLENKFQLRWELPKDTGDSEIVEYQYDLNADNEWKDAGDGSRFVIHNLKNNNLYMVRLRAVNSHGAGKISSGVFGYPSPRRTSSSDQRCISKGSGRSEFDPIVLCSYNDLKGLHNLIDEEDDYIDRIFISLGSHIDATQSFFEGTTHCKPYQPGYKISDGTCEGFQPLPQIRFSSVFGGGYAIFGLYSRRFNTRMGLFSSISHSSKIMDLHLRSVYMVSTRSRRSYVGALVGSVSENSQINGCSVKGGTVFSEHVAGGLIGSLESSKVLNSYADFIYASKRKKPLSVTAMYVGGLVGWVKKNSLIHSSAAISEVSGIYTDGDNDPSAGGLIGYMDDSTTKFSFSNTELNSEGYGGLFAGGIFNDSIIENNVAAGEIDGDGELLGGFVGRSTKTESVNNFWDSESSGLDYAGFSEIDRELRVSFAKGLYTYNITANCGYRSSSELCGIEQRGFEFEEGEYPVPRRCIRCGKDYSRFRKSYNIFEHFNF